MFLKTPPPQIPKDGHGRHLPLRQQVPFDPAGLRVAGLGFDNPMGRSEEVQGNIVVRHGKGPGEHLEVAHCRDHRGRGADEAKAPTEGKLQVGWTS